MKYHRPNLFNARGDLNSAVVIKFYVKLYQKWFSSFDEGKDIYVKFKDKLLNIKMS